MTLALALSEFTTGVAQCESLIANGHKVDGSGAPILPIVDQQQITVAAFLNMFIAWESFLEASLTKLMTGEPTISGATPVRYASPPTIGAANKMLIGTLSHFNFLNHQFVQRVVSIYFDQGYPFEPHLSSLQGDLDDLRTMRNASAHISSTTQTALEGLARRIFGAPQPGITLYRLLTSTDPRPSANGTVFTSYRDKLLVAASLMANG